MISPVPMLFPFLIDILNEILFVFKFHAASKILQYLYVILAESFEEITETFVFSFHCEKLVINSRFYGNRFEAHILNICLNIYLIISIGSDDLTKSPWENIVEFLVENAET